MDLLCFCSVFCLLRLFICALCSPAGKGLTSWLSFVVSNCVFVTFPFGILGQVWYLIVSIPDLCILTFFYLHAIKVAIWKKNASELETLILLLYWDGILISIKNNHS